MEFKEIILGTRRDCVRKSECVLLMSTKLFYDRDINLPRGVGEMSGSNGTCNGSIHRREWSRRNGNTSTTCTDPEGGSHFLG